MDSGGDYLDYAQDFHGFHRALSWHGPATTTCCSMIHNMLFGHAGVMDLDFHLQEGIPR